MSAAVTTPHKPQSLRALKILVAVLGFLILAGLGAIAVAVATRLGGGPARAPAAPAFGEVALPAPPGAAIETVVSDGARLFVILTLADGTRRVEAVDLATGARLGTVSLAPAPSPLPSPDGR